VELALFALCFSLELQEEVEVRIRQAIKRTPLVADVLDPALSRLKEVRCQVRLARGVVRELWQSGQAGSWEMGLNLKQWQEVMTPNGPGIALHWVITLRGERLLCVSHNVGEDPKTHRPKIIWREYPPDQIQISGAREADPPPHQEDVSQQKPRTQNQDAISRTQRGGRD